MHVVMKCIGAVSLAGMLVWVLVLGISVAVRRAARKWDEEGRRSKTADEIKISCKSTVDDVKDTCCMQ
jgi:hypothetical protein